MQLDACKNANSGREILSISDIGCGYGRDAFYFLNNLGCRVLGIDSSKKAIDIASSAIPDGQEGVKFQCCDFTELEEASYDIVFISNLYHLLKNDGRKDLRKAVMRTLKPDGLLFIGIITFRT